MILIRPSFTIEEFYMGDPAALEKIGRACYKSEEKITEGSAEKFIKARLGHHESVIEHSALTVRFICDRGVSHELVRHRLCAISQESTRYCNYKGGITFIIPPWVDIAEGEYQMTSFRPTTDEASYRWWTQMLFCEQAYMRTSELGWSPQQARSVLSNSTKTEIVITANFREWRHIFKMRCDSAAHPQMQELMKPLLANVKELIPYIFNDLNF